VGATGTIALLDASAHIKDPLLFSLVDRVQSSLIEPGSLSIVAI